MDKDERTGIVHENDNTIQATPPQRLILLIAKEEEKSIGNWEYRHKNTCTDGAYGEEGERIHALWLPVHSSKNN